MSNDRMKIQRKNQQQQLHTEENEINELSRAENEENKQYNEINHSHKLTRTKFHTDRRSRCVF